MKRSVKIAALAAALSLCLVLTGCYIAPDDVNNGTGNSTVNNLPFQTMAPTPTVTVTPDTVTVQTQNVFGTTAAQPATASTPTPPPGTAGWSDWGSAGSPTGGPTPIQTGGTIVFNTGDGSSPGPDNTIALVTRIPDTPTPSPAPATPSPTPPSLQLGFTGSESVRSLQRRLKELGYYKGSIDGDFGTNTEKAVKEFQKANGLTADGKAGSKTMEKLNSKNAVTYKQAHATPTPKVTAKPKTTPKATAKATAKAKTTPTPNLSKDYYLTEGTSGKKVETLQRRLIELGWLDGKVTGKYDAATEQAVRAFQKKTSGLWEDGIAGPDTLRALYSSKAARTSKAAASSGETLEFGSEGSAVKTLQQKLKELGYLSGSADGKFGVETQAAVIAFQKNNNLTADGKAGSATQSKLYSGTANKSGGNSVKINKSGGRDTSGIASTGYETLESGSKGSAVTTLQKRLQALGYYHGKIDGSFGDETEAAVMAFQLRNNLTVDGKAGPATQRVLYGTGGKTAVTYSSLREGDSGTAVRNLQYTLYELGYYDGAIDGDYGPTTADAVRAFQIQNKVTPVDGVAGSVTLAQMYSSNAVPATAATVQYDTVGPGDKGDIVMQIQDCLIPGYLSADHGLTGIYDAATEQAIREFQAANSLTVDGVAGSKTLMVLFGY